MKKVFVIRVIYSIIITILLCYFWVKTPNGKLVLIPFLICSFSMLLKNIYSLLGREQYNEVISKVYVIGFLLFWYGFLIFFTIQSIILKNFQLVIFSIPFYIIGGYIIKKSLKK